MVIYDEKVKERLKSGESTPVERFRAEICEAVARNLLQVTVFGAGAGKPKASGIRKAGEDEDRQKAGRDRRGHY